MPDLITDAERARILELHGQGMTRNAIAVEVGRSNGTVTRVVQAAGLVFGAVGQAGRRARHDDLARIRAESITEAHTVVKSILAELRNAERDGYKALVKGVGGSEYEETLHTVPARDRQALANAADKLTSVAERLSKIGQDDGQQATASMLGQLVLGLAQQRPATAPTPEV